MMLNMLAPSTVRGRVAAPGRWLPATLGEGGKAQREGPGQFNDLLFGGRETLAKLDKQSV